MGLFTRLKDWDDGDTLYEADLEAEFDNLYDSIVAATTSVVGMVQLEDSHASTSVTKAACPKNVKEAYDLAGTMLPKATFDANTFIYAVSDNTPVVKTRAEIMSLLSGQASADFAMNSHKFTGLSVPSAAGHSVRATASITETALEDAVTKKHAAGGDDDLDSTFEATFLKRAEYNANTFLYAVSDNTPVVKTRAEVMGLLSGQAVAEFGMNNQKITHVADPTTDQNVATKKYVDDNVGSVSDTVYGADWNGVTGIAPSKNAVYDKIETVGSASISNAVYGAGWNGVADIGASKDAIYDKIETLVLKATFDAGTFLYAVADNVPQALTRAQTLTYLSGQAINDFSMNSKRLSNVLDPASAQDVATKNYVDVNAGSVSDTVYGAGWNGVTGIAPSKNAVYDKIETMGGGGAPDAHKDSHDPADGSDPLDTATPSELASVQAAGTGSSHSLARADHQHQIQHSIADNHIVTIDHAAVADNDYAKFTVSGLEGRSATEMRSDLNIEDGADVTDTTNVNSAGAVMEADFNAKGDILSASADNTPLLLAIGANTKVLTANSAQPTGLEWADAGAPGAHKNTHDPADGSDPLDTAVAAEISAVVAAGAGVAHSFARSDHIHAIVHAITDNHLITVDGTTNQPVSGDYGKFTTLGLEGMSKTQVLSDLNVEDGATKYPDTGEQAFLDADHTKLNGIETSADVTDATNVNTAGAVMESDYNANTFLYAVNNDTPVVKTRAETLALLSGQANASFDMNSQAITKLGNIVTTHTPDAAGTATLDLNVSRIHDITMPAGNITIAVSNESNGNIFTIRILQNGTGNRTVTWFSTIKWAGGSAPTLTTTANKADTVIFRVTGTDTYDGFVVGQNV